MKKTIRKSLFMAAMFLIMCCAMLLPSTNVSAQVKLNTTNVTLSVGQSKTVKISGTSKKAKWSTNKPKVATVSNKGKITAVGQGTATITAKVGKKTYKCKVLVYQASSGNAKLDKKVKAIIQKEIKANMSDAEKVKAIHDYIITHCEYDTADKGKIGNWNKAYGALLNGKAVCGGYAEAFQLCMEAIGIPSQIILGYATEYHAWNLVQVNGNWYHIDLTFDDPISPTMSSSKNSFISYKYFLVNDQMMKKEGRQWHSEWFGEECVAEAYATIPKCTSNYNKFASVIAPISKTPEQAANNLCSEYTKGKRSITIVIPQKTYKKDKDFVNNASSLFLKKIERSAILYIDKYNYGDYALVNISF